MTITSHPATDEYRDGWERVFGGPRFIPANEYRGDASSIGNIELFSFGYGWDEPIDDDHAPLASGVDRWGIREHYEPIGDEL